MVRQHVQPPPFSTEIRHGLAGTTVAFTGDIDVANADSVTQILWIASRLDDGHVVVDLGAVAFIDAHGIRSILAAAEHIGDRLVLLPAPPQVQRVFDLTGTATALPFVAAEEAA